MEKNVIGPVLPSTNSSSEEKLVGPSLPKNREIYGPILPEITQVEQSSIIGPALPKNFVQKNVTGPSLPQNHSTKSFFPVSDQSDHAPDEHSKVIGPVLPAKYLVDKSDEDEGNETPETNSYGPQIPKHLLNKNPTDILDDDDDDDDNVIGPLPAHLASCNSTQQVLNERAEILRFNFRNQITDGPEEPAKRETWMTELPPENSQIFGMGSRKFKPNSDEKKPGRSLWTDTPNSKRKSEPSNEFDFETSAVEKRNDAMDEIVKRSKKHKKDKRTLLEIHQEKLKKKQKEDAETRAERRPFDRDVDLQVNRFDEAQKRSIISKAQLLDSRFKAGQSKYL